VGPKRLELAHELMSSAPDVALVVNANKPTVLNIENGMPAAVRSLGLRLHVLHAGNDTDIEAAFAGFVQLEAGVLVITTDAFFTGMTERLAKLATRHAVPTIFQPRVHRGGWLLSYDGGVNESYRLTGVCAGRILHGEKAGWSVPN
jgi:putative tryptophan/tyrosine transport system substrate-binding protein